MWWSIGLAGLSALLVVAYPTVRGNSELDKTFAQLPKSVQVAVGLGSGSGLTSPVGYMDSQFFANILPAIFLVFAIGAATWSVAGDEQSGMLEMFLASPISRTRLAIARAVAMVTRLGVLVVVKAVVIRLLAPVGDLGQIAATHFFAATLAAALLALAFASIAFCVGAATGASGMATGVAASIAVAGLVIEGLAEQVHVLRAARAASPWHWMLASDPLEHGFTWQSIGLPIIVSVVLTVIGIAVFARRDMR
jgi:ABC-2 type transport system permease protein